MSKKHPTKCTTGARTRCSYLTIHAPKAYGDSKPKFSASLIIPKDDVATLTKIDAAMRAAYEDGVSILKGKGRTIPAYEEIIKDGPLHDGDKKKDGDPAYQNAFYLNAKNERRPGVVDSNKNEILDSSELYSGIYAKAAIGFYCYNKNGNRGIGVSLDYLMKMADGQPLGSTISVDEAFEDEDEDDFLS